MDPSTRHLIQTAVAAFCCVFGVVVGLVAAFVDDAFWAQKMTRLQYARVEGGATYYGAGVDDLYTVGFFALSLTVLRHFMMFGVLEPLGEALRIPKSGDQAKFKQQGWAFAYYTTAFLWGLHALWDQPYFLEVERLWDGTWQ